MCQGVYSCFSLKHQFYSFYVLRCFCIEETPPAPRSPECSCTYKCITHTAIHCYALHPPRETAFNILRCLELEQYLRKPQKDTCIIICGERKKLHLQRNASLVVSLPTGWGTLGTKRIRCSPPDDILSTQHLRIPPLSGPEPLPAPARLSHHWERWLGCHCMLVNTPEHIKTPPSMGWQWGKRRWLDPSDARSEPADSMVSFSFGWRKW